MKMREKEKIVVIILLGLVTLFAVAGLIFSITYKRTMQCEKEVSSYALLSGSNYEVILRPNAYFPEGVQEQGDRYVRNLLDHIDIRLGSDFVCEDEVDLTASYQVYALVRGYQDEGGEKKILWERAVPIIESKEIAQKGTEMKIQEVIPFTLEAYESIGQNATQDLGISHNQEVVLCMEGTLRSEVAKEQIELPILEKVTVPLYTNLFEVTIEGGEETKEAITETVSVSQPMPKGRIVVFSIISVLGLLGVIVIWRFVRVLSEDDLLLKRWNQLLRANKMLLVKLNAKPKTEASPWQVATFKDLKTLAEETQNPLFYLSDDVETDWKRRIFLMDEGRCYFWEQGNL